MTRAVLPFTLKFKINNASVCDNRVYKLLDLQMLGMYLIAVEGGFVRKNRIECKVIALGIKVEADLRADKSVYLAHKRGQTFFHFLHVVFFIFVVSDIPENNVLNHNYASVYILNLL